MGPRSGIQWLAGTPHALVPPRLGTSEARLGRASRSPLHLQVDTPRTTKTYKSLPATADMDSSFPSLMCLLCEDAVHIETFRRACDRNLMLLRIKSLLRRLEKAGAELAAPFTRSSL